MDEMHPKVVPLQQPAEQLYMLDELLQGANCGSVASCVASYAAGCGVSYAAGGGASYAAGGGASYAVGGGIKGAVNESDEECGGAGLSDSDDMTEGSRGITKNRKSCARTQTKIYTRTGNSLARGISPKSTVRGSCRFTESRGCYDNIDSRQNINNESLIEQSNTSFNNIECKYTVTVNLTGEYINITNEILSCVENKSLVDSIMKLLVINATKNGSSIIDDADFINFVIGDKIRLTAELNFDLNGMYQIISLGSSKEPWVLKKI
jgi:hypothetical protein